MTLPTSQLPEECVKEFRKRFVRGVPPSWAGTEPVDADAWVEADIEDLEDFIQSLLDQARKTERARLAKEVRKVFNIITPDGFESPEMCLNELAALEEGFVKLLEDTHLKQIEGRLGVDRE